LLGCVAQVGQFIGTRSDFIPQPICERLSLLQDQVSTQHSPLTYWSAVQLVMSYAPPCADVACMEHGARSGGRACTLVAFAGKDGHVEVSIRLRNLDKGPPLEVVAHKQLHVSCKKDFDKSVCWVAIAGCDTPWCLPSPGTTHERSGDQGSD
jgi:hypothetical protein